MTGNLQGTELSEPLPRQSCAITALLDTRESQTQLIMGRPYRTPSPAPESHYASESESSPKRKSHFETPLVVGTPTNFSKNIPSAPSTPSFQRTFANKLGILTPSTPNFGSPPLKDRGSKVSVENDSDKITATQKPYSSETTVSDATEGIHTDVTDFQKETLDLQETIQQQQSRRDVVEANEDDDSDTDEPLQTQNDNMQQIRDAQLVAELAVDNGTLGKRRSTRLARKPTYTDTKLVISATKDPKKSSTVRAPKNATLPPESSFTTEAVVHLPPDPNPALLTLSWELQYPPGGSTHPSYRYPEMDPRLLFNPALVPIVDGLPMVTHLPPLVLPVGWRHITWSSLLPIVFDPYYQAFKLTPIGPLPLTCEEVQQGGLAKYVPGGECHPEAGMVPDMTALSDGSDEVYNFDGTDWTLPFAKGETFDGNSINDDVKSQGRPCASPITKGELTRVGSPPPPPHYLESRDCPDGIVDIKDAWRWLTQRETSLNTPFIPSPTKTWRGTGIYRSARRFKALIASLMGNIAKHVLTYPNNALAAYLVNQNGREFCAFRSVATPVHIKITLLKDIEITLIELLSYFPSHTAWRKAADRIVRAGLSASDVANIINYTRLLEGDAVRLNNSINDQLWWTYEAPGSKRRVKIVRDKVDEVVSYTAEGWIYTNWELTDYPLLGLTHGLKHLPEGPDAGPLTAMIKWCREQGRYDMLLSNVPELIDVAEVKSLIEAGEIGDPDKEVMGRFANVLKKDRKRVLKIAAERKRAAEREMGRKEKRVKFE